MGSSVVSNSSVFPCQTTLPCMAPDTCQYMDLIRSSSSDLACVQIQLPDLPDLISSPLHMPQSHPVAPACTSSTAHVLTQTSSTSAHLVKEDEPVHSPPDGRVLVGDHDVGSHPSDLSCTGPASTSSHLQGPDQVFHHSGSHWVQACRGLIVHDHLDAHRCVWPVVIPGYPAHSAADAGCCKLMVAAKPGIPIRALH